MVLVMSIFCPCDKNPPIKTGFLYPQICVFDNKKIYGQWGENYPENEPQSKYDAYYIKTEY